MKCLARTNQPGLDCTYAWGSRRRIQLPGWEKRGAGRPPAACWPSSGIGQAHATACSNLLNFSNSPRKSGTILAQGHQNQQQLSIVCRRRKSHQTTGPSRDCTSSKRAAFKMGAGGFHFFPSCQRPSPSSSPAHFVSQQTPTQLEPNRNNASVNGPRIDGSWVNGDRHHDGRRRRRNIGSPGHGHGRHGQWLQDLGSS